MIRPNGLMGRTNYKSGMAQPLIEDVKDATPGKCDPKPVCISNPLTLNITSTQFAFPPCINIHRCDGCCANNEKCVAVGSHEVRLQKVGVINFEEGTDPKFTETFISVLNHTDCQCQCQWESDADCRNVNPNYVRNPSAYENFLYIPLIYFIFVKQFFFLLKIDVNVYVLLKCFVDL